MAGQKHAFHAGESRGTGGGNALTCGACEYFRCVPLPSGHVRTFCIFTGEKVRPSRSACSFRLTSGGLPAMLKAPNKARRNKRLSCFPKAGKSLVIFCNYARTVFSAVYIHIGRVTRPGRRKAPAVSL